MPLFTDISHKKYTGNFGLEEKKHLFSRVFFGSTLQTYKQFENLSLDQAIDLILKLQAPPAPPVNYYEAQTPDTTGIKLGETWVKAAYGDGTINGRRRTSWRSWWIKNMITQTTNIQEKLVLFWHNHFATEVSSYDDARFAYRYLETIRTNSLGDFRKMVKAITLDPAMLLYLNGHRNTKSAPDENYARELQELFTLGKGPGSKYTEDDVKAAAKVLTGFRADREKIGYLFQTANHDTTDKKFSAFYGNKIIKGRTGVDGEKELDDLLEMIFSQNEVSKYVIRRLYSFFVYSDISPLVESNFIEPLAKLYRDSNYELSPVLKTIFTSEHFFDKELRGSMIKSPVDHLIGSVRFIEAELPKGNDLQNSYLVFNDLYTELEKAQQAIGNPPNVAGWQAYYQEPVFYKIWINSSTMTQRVRVSDTLVNKNFKRSNELINFNPLSFLKALPNPSDPVKLIDDLEFYLLHIKISPTLKTQLKKDILLAGQDTDYYWTDLYNEVLNKPTTNNTAMLVSRVRKLVTYLVSLPEYQLS